MDRVRLPRRGVALLLAAGTLALGVPALAAAPALPEDMAMGAATAPVTVVEYASASCPHCARFNNAIFPVFKKKYVDTGQVRYVFREFLTPPTQVAAAAFMVARCAGQARYFTVLDVFFHGQEKMYQTGDVKSALNAAGAAGGLSPDQVKACVADVDALDAVNERAAKYSTEDSIDSTPTFVINGKKLPESDHEVTLADLDAAIAPLLKGSGRR